jgi:hypothetical protein
MPHIPRRFINQATNTILVTAALVLLASTAGAQSAKPLTKCAPDAVVSGTVCMDRFEASVWRVPSPTTINKGLVKKIKQGKATLLDLAKGGAIQLGLVGGSTSYSPCAPSGQNCSNDIFALSLAQVMPSPFISWFQAQVACKNAAKRLPSNEEWQAAVVGTPDPGPDNGATDCNTGTVPAVTPTGSRSGCVSVDGAFDMVGNLYEFTADWVTPAESGCGGAWGAVVSPTGDIQCLVGASTAGQPGALTRGGSYDIHNGSSAGPLAVFVKRLADPESFIGFRCAR